MKTHALAAALLLVSACGSGKVDNVKRKPVAAFQATQSAARPQAFNLDAAASYATVGDLASWYWTFGDSATAPRTLKTSPAALYAYATPGSYVITLVVADDKGTESEPFSQTVTVPAVNSDLPQAHLTGPSTGTAGSALSFDGSTSTPASDLKSYAWNFGDPASAENSVSGAAALGAQHAFTSAGSYLVTLTVTDSLGQSDTAELPVAVFAPGPVAVCAYSPQPALLGVPVTFDASGSTPLSGSTLTGFSWDFGDGSPAATAKISKHTYNVLSTFHPKLKVTDSLARSSESACPDVVVTPPPQCTGDYTLTANPSSISACLSTINWAGNKLSITQFPDGGMVATEALASGVTALDGGSTGTYSGGYVGADFTLTGGYLQSTGLVAVQTNVTLVGKLAGCGSFTGTWHEALLSSGISVCSYTFNVSGAKL